MTSYRHTLQLQAWGLYDGDSLVATCRARTAQAAIWKLGNLPKHLRQGAEPSNRTVRALL